MEIYRLENSRVNPFSNKGNNSLLQGIYLSPPGRKLEEKHSLDYTLPAVGVQKTDVLGKNSTLCSVLTHLFFSSSTTTSYLCLWVCLPQTPDLLRCGIRNWQLQGKIKLDMRSDILESFFILGNKSLSTSYHKLKPLPLRQTWPKDNCFPQGFLLTWCFCLYFLWGWSCLGRMPELFARLA